MAGAKTNTVVYRSVAFDATTGEAVNTNTVYRVADEPAFVKLYVENLLWLRGIRKGLCHIFIALMRYVTYASSDDLYGGNVIFLNKGIKDMICKELDIGIDSLNKAVYELTKAGIFCRRGQGTYQVNPTIVGKGSWKDLQNIQGFIDYGSKTVVANVVHKDSTEADMNFKTTFTDAEIEQQISVPADSEK